MQIDNYSFLKVIDLPVIYIGSIYIVNLSNLMLLIVFSIFEYNLIL